MLRPVYTLLFFMLAGLCGYSQEKEYILENITQQEGLPANESYYTYIDSKGFLWIATDHGVARFNGSYMERFELPDNVIFKIREDEKGRIWFFSYTGKLAFHQDGKIIPYKFNDSIASHIEDILIIDAFVGEDDEIVLAAKYTNLVISPAGHVTRKDIGLERFGRTVSFTVSKGNKKRLLTRQTRYIEGADSIEISIEKGNGLTNKKYTLPCYHEVPAQFGCITNDNRTFYFYSYNKILRLNPDGTFIIKQFPANILCLQFNRQDNLWVGLIGHGVSLVDPNLEEISNTSLLNPLSVSSVSVDHEGGTWFSTLEKGIFHLKDPALYYLRGDKSLENPVSRIYQTGAGEFLYAGSEGVYRYKNNAPSTILNIKSEAIHDLFTDSLKNIYLAGKYSKSILKDVAGEVIETSTPGMKYVAVIHASTEMVRQSKFHYFFFQGQDIWDIDIARTKLNGGTGKFINRNYVKSGIRPAEIYRDYKGQIWLGSLLGLYRVAPGKIMPTPVYNAKDRRGITGIRQMQNRMYVWGVRFGGIVLTDTTDKILASITEKDGLLSNSTGYLLPIADQLWVATAKGISIITFHTYDPISYSITNIGKNHGFANVLVNQLMALDDKILAATNNGIFVIENPAKILNREKHPLPFYIQSVSYFKGDTSAVSELLVPHKNNRVKIRFSAVCFNAPQDLKYLYRLNATDTVWQTISGNELLLENLSPGNYIVQLKAMVASEHRSSEILEMKLTVSKPWWRNNWFRLMLALCLIGLGYVFYRKRIKSVQKRERLKGQQYARMLELEHTALRSQMNPHFIFNCLTSIQQLIMSGNKFEANEHLVKFARLIRKTLALSETPYIRLSDEIEYLTEYLQLEQLRIPGQFDFIFNIHESVQAEQMFIPNMMLQPILENAIRHGIMHLVNKKGMITIEMKKHEQMINCTITDNGVGRKMLGNFKNDPALHKSYGIEIVTKRVELLANEKAGDYFIKITDLKNEEGLAQGTSVTIQLPFKPSEV